MQDAIIFAMFGFGVAAWLMVSYRLAVIKEKLEKVEKELDWLHKRLS